jgi:PqqD family protein of HPr-rel-A system
MLNDRSSLKNLAMSETGFVFDPRSGATYTLNLSGITVLRALRDGLDLSEVARTLQEEHEATPMEVKEDVLDFVQALIRLGLVPQGFRVA